MTPIDPPGAKEFYAFGPFRVDPEKQLLLRGDDPVPITPKAFQILLALIRHGQEVVTKDDLMKAVWPETFVEEGNLSRTVFMLRKALGDSAQDRFILTIPGRGYRFAEQIRVMRVDPAEPRIDIAVATHSQTQVDVLVRRRTGWTTAAAVIAAVVVAAVGIAAVRWVRQPRPLLTAKDTLVLADFANMTGDPVFDVTLRQGLVVQFEQSPVLSVVSDQRIHQVLQLMRQPQNAPLMGERAREVCERAGAAGVVEGSIANLGTRYVLGLKARQCRTGDSLADEQAQAARKEEVLTVLSDMVRRFRERLGESLGSVQQHSTRLDEATTSSLEALRAYSAGSQAHAARGASASLPLFQRAVEIDPGFALAQAWVGRAYADLDQSDLAAASIERAWELRERTSEPERYFLTTLYQTLVIGNLEAARQTCETWAREYPRDARPHAALAGIVHKAAGRFEAGLAEAQRTVAANPDFAIGYYSLGTNHQYLGRLGEAEQALSAAAARGLDIDEFVMLAYELAFLKNDATRLEREAARGRARAGGETWMSAREAFVAAYSGHVRSARRLSDLAIAQARQAGQPERAGLWEAGAAVREALFGNRAEAERRAVATLELPHAREAEYGAALALSMVGNVARALPLVDDLARRFPEDSSMQFSALPVLRAQLALNRNEPEAALDVLQVASAHELGLARSTVSGLFGSLYPIYVRGEAYLLLRRGTEAAAQFQKIIDHRTIVASDPIGVLSRLQLGRAYALAGDRTGAKSAYDDFLALWREADGDIPVLEQARAERAQLR